MKKHLSLIILILLIAILSVFVGCGQKTPVDEYKDKGYKVSVIYNSNGGNYMGREGITIMDMMKPEDYRQENGVYKIPLTEPTDPGRPSGGSDPIILTKQGYFFAGWYQERKLVTNSDNEVLDWNGKPLYEKDGVYYLKGAQKETKGFPACESYSGYWDFANDRVEYSGEDVTITLYAGWVPYYRFDFYRQNENNEWEVYNYSEFDYKTTNAANSKNPDRDTIYTPSYVDGAMNYSSKYPNGDVYNFPAVEGMTFESAYTDPSCTEETKITGSYEHPGTLDLQTGTAIDRVQSIYVKFLEGEIFHINTAEELAKNAVSNGIYYIESDLDFKAGSDDEVTWPSIFVNNGFSGKIYGNGHKISNVSVLFTSTSARCGGLFGKLESGSLLENLTFDGVTVDYSKTGSRISDGTYGLLAGDISYEANVSDVSLQGALYLKIGYVSLTMKTESSSTGSLINLVACGDTSGVTCDVKSVKLWIYGEEYEDKTGVWYLYSVAVKDDDNNILVSVSDDGYVNMNVGGNIKDTQNGHYEIEH